MNITNWKEIISIPLEFQRIGNSKKKNLRMKRNVYKRIFLYLLNQIGISTLKQSTSISKERNKVFY